VEEGMEQKMARHPSSSWPLLDKTTTTEFDFSRRRSEANEEQI
jgi:hypothetical protein